MGVSCLENCSIRSNVKLCLEGFCLYRNRDCLLYGVLFSALFSLLYSIERRQYGVFMSPISSSVSVLSSVQFVYDPPNVSEPLVLSLFHSPPLFGVSSARRLSGISSPRDPSRLV